MKNITYTLIIALFLGTSLLSPFITHAQEANFDPGYIISDSEILDTASMTAAEVQTLLENKNSFLATYQVTDPNGNTMLASQAIFERAVTNGVSQKFLVVLLQKEQGLIENPAPSQGRLDWAAGYGCPDGGGCNSRWKGFWKQINSASLQFKDYMDNPQLYGFKAGQTYTFTNPYSATVQGDTIVTIRNQATAGLYNYTPHVYNGNYNFWKIWQRYFTRSYLNGSLLQAEGETGVWLIENGIKRAFLSRSALTSRYDINHVQIVSKADIDKYPTGQPIRFAQYSIIRLPNGRIYLLVDNTKRRFANPEAFKKLGFNPEEIIPAGLTELDDYVEGEAITTTSAYLTGALLQDKSTGGVYWYSNGVKSPIWDSMFLKTRYKNRKVIPVASAELATYQTGTPIRFNDGDLVKSPNGTAVYVIENGVKRAFDSGETFVKLGYKWSNIMTFSQKILDLHSDGPVVTATIL